MLGVLPILGHLVIKSRIAKHEVLNLLDAGAFVFTSNGLYQSIPISSVASGMVVPSQRAIPECHSQLVLMRASSQQSLLGPSCKNQLINLNWHHLSAHADHQGPRQPTNGFDTVHVPHSQLFPQLLKLSSGETKLMNPIIPPYPVGIDPDAYCDYHSGAPNHSIEGCMAFRDNVPDPLDSKASVFTPDSQN